MSEPVHLVYMTAATREEALKIGRALVHEKLAACVNILGPSTSVYHWQGAIQESEETSFIAKTTARQVAKLSERVKALHSYDTPCVVSVPIAGGNEDFIQWLVDSCLK